MHNKYGSQNVDHCYVWNLPLPSAYLLSPKKPCHLYNKTLPPLSPSALGPHWQVSVVNRKIQHPYWIHPYSYNLSSHWNIHSCVPKFIYTGHLFLSCCLLNFSLDPWHLPLPVSRQVPPWPELPAVHGDFSMQCLILFTELHSDIFISIQEGVRLAHHLASSRIFIRIFFWS